LTNKKWDGDPSTYPYRNISGMDQEKVIKLLDNHEDLATIFTSNYYLQKNIFLDRLLDEYKRKLLSDLTNYNDKLEQEQEFYERGSKHWLDEGYSLHSEVGEADQVYVLIENDEVVRIAILFEDGSYYAGDPIEPTVEVEGIYISNDGEINVGTFLGDAFTGGLNADQKGVKVIGRFIDFKRDGMTLFSYPDGTFEIIHYQDGVGEGLNLLFDENGMLGESIYENSMMVLPITERK
jgi:hypothetical protein